MFGIHSMYSGIGIASQSNGCSGLFLLFLFRNSVNRTHPKLCKLKATGLDMISARLLRECADLIADPMCSIFNQSIRSGIFPQEWKCAKVIPLFKE